METLVLRAVLQALREESGDVLVFLPGAREIRRVQGLLQGASIGANTQVLPLYGELSAADQDAALAPAAPGARKVVLATNIAETSLTITGIRVVVDSGVERRSEFDPVTGMSRLVSARISRASAEQRAGRAGRLESGVCYRVWSEGSQRSLAAFSTPEILAADLAGLALELACWGVVEVGTLTFLDPPPAAQLGSARDLLRRLGGVDAASRITAHGRDMAALGLHPRLAHMLLKARPLGLVKLAADLAALLSERDLLRAARGQDTDVHTRLQVLYGRGGEVDPAVLARVRRVSGDLQRQLDARTGAGAAATSISPSTSARASVARGGAAMGVGPASVRGGAATGVGPASARGGAVTGAGAVSAPSGNIAADAGQEGLLLAFAYPDRIALRREGGEGRYLLANGRGAVFPDAQQLRSRQLVVAVDLDDRDRDARVLLAAALDRDDLERHFVSDLLEQQEVVWNEREQAVSARRVVRLGALELTVRPLREIPPDAALAAMLQGVRQLGLSALPWDEDVRQLQARLEFVRRSLGRRAEGAGQGAEGRQVVRTGADVAAGAGSDVGGRVFEVAGSAADRDAFEIAGAPWPAVDDDSLMAGLDIWLAPWLDGCLRREHLSRVPLEQALLAMFSREQQQKLAQLAPTHLTVPTGSRIRIDYRDELAPVVSVRIQEVFGLLQTPRIVDGRVPVTFKLLSPAQRPLQITRDLAGFWRGSYAEVRKDMRGRYPRHYWPEDPAVAEPTRRAKPRGT
jgi:ATP-dependent helicase HrpB